MTQPPIRICIMGSGAGTTAQAIISAIAGVHYAAIVLVLTNTSKAGICSVARVAGIPCVVVDPADGATISRELRNHGVDLVVLAGYLKLLPADVIAAMDGRVVNTHPALLPRYGGAGMYGKHVHRAVAHAGDTESGVTLHWVTARYDEGTVIAQARVALVPGMSPESIEQTVRQTEKEWLPVAILELAQSLWKKRNLLN